MLFSISGFTQSKTPKTLKKTFYYSFENVTSADQIERLKSDVALLKDVTEVKSNYKTETAMGQIIVVVIEKEVTREGEREFDITGLKNLIIRNQLTPLELTQEEIIISN
jgi:hypothetical protein